MPTVEHNHKMDKNKSNFEILSIMADEDKEVALFVNSVTAMNSNKKGATLTVALANEWAQKVARMSVGGDAYHVMLFVVKQSDYEEIKNR